MSGGAPAGPAGPVILLVGPRPPPAGGIATWTESVLASPLARGFSIQPFDTAPRDATDRPSESRFKPVRAARALLLLVAFGRALRRLRPAIVHVSTSYHWALLRDGAFLWWARARGARTVLHLHGGDFPEFVARCPGAVRWLVWATLRRADAVVVLTSDTRRCLERQIGAARVREQPNFVGLPDRIVGAPVAASAPAGASPPAAAPVRVVFVGAVIEAKGVLDLVAAVARVPEFELTLAGPPDAALLPALEALCAPLGPRAQILGARTAPEVQRLLANADVFALPSHREGLPLALLEAMAAGLAVVVSRVGAMAEVVRDGESGLVVEPRDVDALAAALRGLAADPGLRRRLGAAARQRVEASYSLASGTSRLAALWSELTAS